MARRNTDISRHRGDRRLRRREGCSISDEEKRERELGKYDVAGRGQGEEAKCIRALGV